MQILIISSNNSRHTHWHLTRFRVMLLVVMIASLMVAGSTIFTRWIQTTDISVPHLASSFSVNTAAFSAPLHKKTPSNPSVQPIYAKQLGGLQAEAIRLKVLSERLAKIAGLNISEFRLGKVPARGGIEERETTLSGKNFQSDVDKLVHSFAEREQTLSALQQYLITNDNITSAIPSGMPVKKGWMSSFFGYRIDPFNGKKAFHSGIDFANKRGTKIYSVADGIVTWAGKRGGYGNLVEVDHGNGYVTRYGHNEKIKVHVGDMIRKGQVLALMGSTGRSTGPHVHFEVLRDGKKIDPYSFVKK